MADNTWENGMKENRMEKDFMFLKMELKKKEYGKMEKESNGYQMTKKNSDIYLLNFNSWFSIYFCIFSC
jgi:hypothetical protein